jgi:hypothetical protein
VEAQAARWNSDQLFPAEAASENVSDHILMHVLAEDREIAPVLMISDFLPSEVTWSGAVTGVAARELH